MTRTKRTHDIDGGGAIIWALGITITVILATIAVIVIPTSAEGYSLYASASARQREGRALEFEGVVGGVLDSGPYRTEFKISQEKEADAPGQGGTIYTDLDWRASYKGDRFGAGARWARIEEHNMRFAETFAELRWSPGDDETHLYGTFGIGSQQRYAVDLRDPVFAARFSYEISRDIWRLTPAIRANAALSWGKVWTTDVAATVPVALSEHWSLAWDTAWERRGEQERVQSKATLKVGW